MTRREFDYRETGRVWRVADDGMSPSVALHRVGRDTVHLGFDHCDTLIEAGGREARVHGLHACMQDSGLAWPMGMDPRSTRDTYGVEIVAGTIAERGVSTR